MNLDKKFVCSACFFFFLLLSIVFQVVFYSSERYISPPASSSILRSKPLRQPLSNQSDKSIENDATITSSYEVKESNDNNDNDTQNPDNSLYDTRKQSTCRFQTLFPSHETIDSQVKFANNLCFQPSSRQLLWYDTTDIQAKQERQKPKHRNHQLQDQSPVIRSPSDCVNTPDSQYYGVTNHIWTNLTLTYQIESSANYKHPLSYYNIQWFRAGYFGWLTVNQIYHRLSDAYFPLILTLYYLKRSTQRPFDLDESIDNNDFHYIIMHPSVRSDPDLLPISRSPELLRVITNSAINSDDQVQIPFTVNTKKKILYCFENAIIGLPRVMLRSKEKKIDRNIIREDRMNILKYFKILTSQAELKYKQYALCDKLDTVLKEKQYNEYNREFLRVSNTAPVRITIIKRITDRQLLNLDELVSFLENQYSSNTIKIRVVILDNMPLEDIIHLFSSETDILIGVHGAGLANSYFLPENSITIELSPFKLVHYYDIFVTNLGLIYWNYRQIVNEHDKDYHYYCGKDCRKHDNIRINIQEFNTQVMQKAIQTIQQQVL